MVTSRRAPRAANVKTQSLPRIVSDDEEQLLRNGGDIQSTQRYSEENTLGDATITHTRPGRVLMWKPGPDGHYTPRTVSESAKEQNYRNGWKFKCPDCGTNHEASPYPPGEPNSCPARDQVPFRICPVASCNGGNPKRIYDTLGLQSRFEGDDMDPNIIKDEAFAMTTPQERTRLLLDLHLWTFHARYAQASGRPPLPIIGQHYDGNTRPI